MLIPTVCPIDGTDEYDEELYPANFDVSQIGADIFNARRSSDRIHYRMVRSQKSSCIRANPILSEDRVLSLYESSHVTYEVLLPYVVQTYLRYGERARRLLPDLRGVLEIGCGSGWFLSRISDWGFERVLGVELSKDAVAKAPPQLQGRIVEGTIDRARVAPNSFSLVTGFQVLDHIVDPNAILKSCHAALCPGGIMYWICHDIGSHLARLLGERCPIVDIQHTVLYDKKTLAALFRQNGFEVVDQFSVSNRYPLGYWMKLAPLPIKTKRAVLSALNHLRLSELPVSGYFGNMGIIARKPVL